MHVTITSIAAPTLRWTCPRCDHDEFVSSDRFRMNCNGKLADIWLIYRCGRCDSTKNLTVVERTPTRRIAPALFEAATANDASAARAVARDLSVIKAAGARVARGDRFEVSRSDLITPATLHLEFPEPLLVRLDEVIARALAIPRSVVRASIASGATTVAPEGRPDKLRLWAGATVEIGQALTGSPPTSHVVVA